MCCFLSTKLFLTQRTVVFILLFLSSAAAKADINRQAIDGNTALHLAVENGGLEIVKLLLRNINQLPSLVNTIPN